MTGTEKKKPNAYLRPAAIGVCLTVAVSCALYMLTARYSYATGLEVPNGTIAPGDTFTVNVTVANTGNRALVSTGMQLWSYPAGGGERPEPALNEQTAGMSSDMSRYIVPAFLWPAATLWVRPGRQNVTLADLNGAKLLYTDRIVPGETWTVPFGMKLSEDAPNQIQGRQVEFTVTVRPEHSKLWCYYMPLGAMLASAGCMLLIVMRWASRQRGNS